METFLLFFYFKPRVYQAGSLVRSPSLDILETAHCFSEILHEGGGQ